MLKECQPADNGRTPLKAWGCGGWGGGTIGQPAVLYLMKTDLKNNRDVFISSRSAVQERWRPSGRRRATRWKRPLRGTEATEMGTTQVNRKVLLRSTSKRKIV